MKLGLIGHPLGHSWSPEIHSFLIHEEYQKWDVAPEHLAGFLDKKDFDGINVTIPYKQAVLPYLDELDESAARIGAVNCIVNRNGKLVGYNTDCIGFRTMLMANHIDVKGKKTAVLGTGGASRAVKEALSQMGAEIISVSRHAKEDAIDYPSLYERCRNIEIIVNTTPVGMYPDVSRMPVDLNAFVNLKAYVDIVANPFRTLSAFHAKLKNIPYLGGLEMLVRQAFAADEIFIGRKLDPDMIQPCMDMLYQKKRNIVLIGMPTSGKTTIARMLGEMTGRQVVEMDDEIEMKLSTSIARCFAEKGELYFREIEKETAFELRNKNSIIISCGGGVIKSEETMRYLSENGIVVWIQRDLNKLYATTSRPLTKNHETIVRLYEERKDLYRKYSDVIVDNDGTLKEAADEILRKTGGITE